eukprot:TRINITY_DN10693_c0_g1_i1.p1 TRINITY_DN10693_c0_g1~~TRINITY_DN10693_c0_g1_i1.p1  ORF type:complete len:990 (+),score=162.51 TRINITY_DN10693_c0_g1_i1:16-2985(+)
MSDSFQDPFLYTIATPQTLLQMLQTGTFKPEARNAQGRTPLHVIAANPENFRDKEVAYEMAKLLLKKGSTGYVNFQDSLGYTALHLACESGFIALVRKLLMRKADVWIRTNTGTLALHILAAGYVKDDRINYYKVLEEIIRKMNSVLSAVNNRKDTVLHFICGSKRASEETLRFILNKDSSFINHHNNDGFTPLHTAIRVSRPDMIKTLMEMGADPAIASPAGTCITLASAYCPEVVPRLQGGVVDKPEPKSSSSFLSDPLGNLGNLGKETMNKGKETMSTLSLGLGKFELIDNYLGKGRGSKEMNVISNALRAPLPNPPVAQTSSPSRLSPHKAPRAQSEVLSMPPLPPPPSHKPKMQNSVSSNALKVYEPRWNDEKPDRVLAFERVENTGSSPSWSSNDSPSDSYDYEDEFDEFVILEEPKQFKGNDGSISMNDESREENFIRDAVRNTVNLRISEMIKLPRAPVGAPIKLPFNLLEGESVVDTFGALMAQQYHEFSFGSLHLTSYRLVFTPYEVGSQSKKSYKIGVPLGAITKFDIISEVAPPYCWYRICRRDFNDVILAMMNSEEGSKITRLLEGRICVKSFRELFAFSHKRMREVDMGWSVYDVNAEYGRLKIPNGIWKIVDYNKLYTLCPTYPKTLAVLSELSSQDLQSIASFRTKSRLPVLVWNSPTNQSVIIRCSQPSGGMTNSRNKEDEKFFHLLGVKCSEVIIYDARPRLNAYANHLTGGGGENMKHYPSCKRKFLNIGNIHVMRAVFEKLKKALVFQEPNANALRSSAVLSWLEQIQNILTGAMEVVLALTEPQRIAAVVHCSDGWDRTSQIVALAELMLDPYYRTIRGFIVLIEKEWLSFGHKFTDRTGPGCISSKVKERAPIFHQFIDCVWQIQAQFKSRFEFTEKLLIFVLRHLYSCRFGTFFGDSDKERHSLLQLQTSTYSMWTYVINNEKAFKNPEYSHYNEQYNCREIMPNREYISFWTAYYINSIYSEDEF